MTNIRQLRAIARLASVAALVVLALSGCGSSAPTSTTRGNSALNGTPARVGRPSCARPTVCVELWYRNNGMSAATLTPIGSTMSPVRSTLGVVAMPSIVRCLSSIDLMVSIE